MKQILFISIVISMQLSAIGLATGKPELFCSFLLPFLVSCWMIK